MITNKLGGAILVGVGMLICPLRSHAATLGCPAFPTPKIEISVDPPDDRTITTKSLDQMHAAGKIRHPAPVVGVYLGALQYGIQIDDTVRQAGAGRFCATPKYVTLKLGLERIIYIPHEFADDPCLSSLAHDHEAKHADSDIKAFEIARPALESAVRMAVSRATTEA